MQKVMLIVICVATATLILLLKQDNEIGSYVAIPVSQELDLSEWDDMPVEEAMRRRRERVRRVCKRLKEKEHVKNRTFWPVNNNPAAFLTVKRYKLGYCTNSKVGTSTWKNHLLSLLPLPSESVQSLTSDVHTLHENAEKLLNPFGTAYQTNLKSFPTFIEQEGIFMFSPVRHPFERLVSTYEDKILDHGPGRSNHFKNIAQDIGTDFKAFANSVIEEAKEKGCNVFACDINIHYRPYFVRCGYCSINYDAIAKVETFSRDAKYIFDAVGATDNENLASLSLVRHNTTVTGDSRQESKDRSMKYFRSLDAEVKQALLKLYWIDFEMFGYSADEYM